MKTADDTTDFPFLLSGGTHDNASGECCLVELASLQPVGCSAASMADLVKPSPGMVRDDHDPTVCYVRAAFARGLNDSYPNTPEGRQDLTRENWRTACALKGTAARKDSADVARYLFLCSMRDWWPPVLRVYSRVLREEGGEKSIAAADAIDRTVDKLIEIGNGKGAARAARADLADLADRAALAAFAAFADRAARAALADFAAFADLAARADLAAFAAFADLAARAARADLADEIRALTKRLRTEMALALYETCAEGWTVPE